MNTKHAVALIVGLAFAALGCGSGDPKTSAVYRSLLTDVQELESEVVERRSVLTTSESQLDELKASIDAALVARGDAEAALASARQSAAEAKSRLETAEVAADLAIDEANGARDTLAAAKSSDGYLQHLTGQFENMLSLICPSRTLKYLSGDPIGPSAFMTDQGLIGRDLNTEVEACVDRNFDDAGRFVRQMCGTRYDPARVDKRPADYAGQCFSGSNARVFQFDSNTGPCGFLASVSSEFNVLITAGPEPVSEGLNCDEFLGPLVKDTRFDYWVLVRGAHTYDTSIGGRNTVVHLTLLYYEYY